MKCDWNTDSVIKYTQHNDFLCYFVLSQDQINTHVWPGALDVYTYYGADRVRDTDHLAQKDIVLTTYQTVTSDYTKVKLVCYNKVFTADELFVKFCQH